MKSVVLALLMSCQLIITITITQGVLASPENSHWHSSLSSHAGVPVSRRAPESLDDNTKYAHSLNDTAYQLLLQGSFQEAEGRVRQALSFDPNFVSAHCNLGYILNKTGRAREALPHLLFAYKLDPNEPAVLQSLGASYQLQGNFETAISVYNEYLARFPSATDAAFISDLITHLKMESAKSAIAKTTTAVGNGKIAHVAASAQQANAAGLATSPESNGQAAGQNNLDSTQNYSWKKRHVKVYVQPATDVTGYRPSFDVILRDSFRNWSQAGVISFEFVPRKEDADIECIWTDDVKKLASESEGGETVLREAGGTVSHARLTLLTTRRGEPTMTDRDVQALCLHEIGHALGLMKHSGNPDDVMFCTLATSHPSTRDLQNLQTLYKQ